MNINEAVTRLFEVARATDETAVDEQTAWGAHKTHKSSRSEATEQNGIPSCLPLHDLAPSSVRPLIPLPGVDERHRDISRT